MKLVTSKEIADLLISPAESVDWAKEAFLIKDNCILPPKISIHPRGNDFFNTMPCLLPEKHHLFGCKVVSRVKGTHPSLKSDMMVFDTLTGGMIALVNCDWITARRTGAVAAIAINTLRKTDAQIYSFIGLGVIARNVLDCLIATNLKSKMEIRLMRYKDHAEKIIDEYSHYPNVSFTVVDTVEEFARNADVIISCITDAEGLIVEDVNLFKPGVLVVPVHTRGFQNCDTIFDKVIADDHGHVCGFKYFSQFRYFAELSDVLKGKKHGRENDTERILAYNIGLGLHDIFFASKILDKLNFKNPQ